LTPPCIISLGGAGHGGRREAIPGPRDGYWVFFGVLWPLLLATIGVEVLEDIRSNPPPQPWTTPQVLELVALVAGFAIHLGYGLRLRFARAGIVVVHLVFLAMAVKSTADFFAGKGGDLGLSLDLWILFNVGLATAAYVSARNKRAFGITP
jgi:hypothetical protein